MSDKATEDDFKDLMAILEKSKHKLPKVEYSGNLVTITSKYFVMVTSVKNYHDQMDKAIKKYLNENKGHDDSV